MFQQMDQEGEYHLRGIKDICKAKTVVEGLEEMGSTWETVSRIVKNLPVVYKRESRQHSRAVGQDQVRPPSSDRS